LNLTLKARIGWASVCLLPVLVKGHDVATDFPKEGIVKFTVVSGVLSGYQLLMKPVVYTVKQEAESMGSGRDAVAEDRSMMAQSLVACRKHGSRCN